MKKIQLKSIEDLAYLASSSPLGATIEHIRINDKDFYFIIGGTMNESFTYYVEGEKTNKRFINFNTTKSKVEYSDLPTLDPKIKVIPIIEIKKQDFINFG